MLVAVFYGHFTGIRLDTELRGRGRPWETRRPLYSVPIGLLMACVTRRNTRIRLRRYLEQTDDEVSGPASASSDTIFAVEPCVREW